MVTNRKHNTRLRALEARHVRDVVEALISTPTPARDITRLVALSHGPGASPFERYAGMALEDAGAEGLTQLPPLCHVQLIPPAHGHLVRLICSATIDEHVDSLLMDVENALNRLLGIADAIEDSADLDERMQAKPRIGMSPLGFGYLPTGAPWRSASVRLPEIGPSQAPSSAYFSEVDWRVLDHVAVNAHAVFQNSLLPNLHQSFMGAHAPDGSDWDVRTRLASILGGLELTLRCDCRFDCDVERSTAYVRFGMPPASSFPHRKADARGALADASEDLDNARETYCIRLACLLAAACFGAGRHIDHADIQAFQGQVGNSATLFRYRFNRHDYVHSTLCAIDSGELSCSDIRFDPVKAAEVACIELKHDLRSQHDFDEGDAERAGRRAVHLDDRELPAGMQRLFHAHRICDIDTAHYHGERGESVHEALKDSQDSIVTAIAHLEGVVESLEASTCALGEDADARPLFCENALSRAVVSLLDDELSIARQAESFLQGEEMEDSPVELPRYFRAPSALYHAHMGLSDLYERLGDLRGAEAEADRCIMLAPTTASAYFRKADVLAQQRRFAEAANVILAGLHIAIDRKDCALLYYHLALLLWNMGRKNDAAAVHVYTSSLEGEYAEKAKKAVEGLRKRDNASVIVFASPLAAAQEMKRSRIPVVPSDEARALVLRAAVGLACANAPSAAAPYAAEIARYFRDDRIIVATAQSLIDRW